MKHLQILLVVAVSVSISAPAWADWQPGDPFTKWQQLPDPNGWDVDITTDTIYDDFQCTATGPITDIHFWISWKGDLVDQIEWIDVSFHGDVPVGADPDPNIRWSHPDSLMYDTTNQLWFRRFQPGEFIDVFAGDGNQGWLAPSFTQPEFDPNDHRMFYQVNIPVIDNPFIQEQGTIYWIGIHIAPAVLGPEIGWKTSIDHWNDDAAYWYGGWKELIDPLSGESLDMAFVLTTIPEPATLGLLALGVMSVITQARRSR